MLKIEVLRQDHDRKAFDCGVEELNQYLRNIARQHLRKGISRTFVLIDDAQSTKVLGFFTLAVCEIQVDKMPQKFAKKYPARAPAAKLGRLAVAKDQQRQGLGAIMMINAIERVLTISENVGIIGFFVDAKDENARKYYQQFGFISLPKNPLELFLPYTSLLEAYATISKR